MNSKLNCCVSSVLSMNLLIDRIQTALLICILHSLIPEIDLTSLYYSYNIQG